MKTPPKITASLLVIGLLNLVVLQWFCMRVDVAYVMRLAGGETVPDHFWPDCWQLTRWVWPLTGFFGIRARYISDRRFLRHRSVGSSTT